MRSMPVLLILLLASAPYALPLVFSPSAVDLPDSPVFLSQQGKMAQSLDEVSLSPERLWLRHLEGKSGHFFEGQLQQKSWGKASFFPTYGLPQRELLLAQVYASGKPVTDLMVTSGLIIIEGDVASIDVELSQGFVKINRLKRKPSELSLSSNPEGGAVRLDQQEVGETPLVIPATILPDVTVEIEKQGFAVYRKMVELRPGRTHRIKADLMEIPPDAKRVYPYQTLYSTQGTPSIQALQMRVLALQERKEAGKLNAFGEKLLEDLQLRLEEMRQELFAVFIPASVLEFDRYDHAREVYPVRATILEQGFHFQFTGELSVRKDERNYFEKARRERVSEETTMKLSSRSQKKTYPKRPGQSSQAGVIEITYRNNVIQVERSGKVDEFFHDIVGMKLLQGGKGWPLRGEILFPSWFDRAPGWNLSRERLAVLSNDTLSAWRPSRHYKSVEMLEQSQTAGDQNTEWSSQDLLPPELKAETSPPQKGFWKTSGRYLSYVAGLFLSGYALKEHYNALEKRDQFEAVSAADAQAREKSIRDNEKRRNAALFGAGIAFSCGLILAQF